MFIENAFPKLRDSAWQKTSEMDPRYNCIAWAAGQTQAKWWPDPEGIGHWPPGVPRQETLEAFILAFESQGYIRDADVTYEEGFERIAIYALSGMPKHAA